MRLWGFRRQEVTIIGARTSNGKSAFINQLAWDFACQGKNILFLSLEMPVDRIIERLFCYVEKIDNYEILIGQYARNPDYQRRWARFSQELYNKNIIFCDYIGKTWEQIDKTIAQFAVKPDVLFVDHVHHISSRGSYTEKQTIDDYLEHFREMVIRGNFVGILNAQINRTSQEEKEGEPQLHHLKSTGKLEEIADNALILWWPWHNNKNKPMNLFKINVAKNRYGSPGYIDLDYTAKHYAFKDYIPPAEKVNMNIYKD